MPRDKDFKRHVRRRMGETGERYTDALAWLRADPDRPIEWALTGDQREAYAHEVAVDEGAPGRRVAVLRSIADPGQGFGALVHHVDTAGLTAGRIRFSAVVSGQDVAWWAGLWVRIDGVGERGLAFDNMQDRPLSGTFNGQPAAVVLDVPAGARAISYGLLLAGTGTVRIAAPRLEAVDESVPTTGRRAVDGWSLNGNRTQSYRLDSEDDDTPEGRRTVAVLCSVEDPLAGFGTMSRSVPAAPWRGRRLRLSALVRGEDVSGWTGLWMRMDAHGREILALDNMQDRPLSGSFDWTAVSVVLDVPEEAEQIPHGVLLTGEGTIRVTAARLEAVDESVPATGRRLRRGGPQNRGRPDVYRVTREPADTPNGRQDVDMLRCVADPGDGFGSVTRGTVAAPHHGRRVRLSALVHGEGVDGWAGLWMRVDGPGRTLAFDNMQDRRLRGTFDWTEASVVLDVAPEAGSVAYGMLLVGRGTVRAADLQLQQVPADVPLTSGRGIPGWMVSGSRPDAYEVRVEPDERDYAGRRVLRIDTVTDPRDGTIDVGQVVPAEGYRRRPVRLRAAVSAWGGGMVALLLALVGDDQELLLERRPLGGAFDWKDAEVEVVVSDEVEFIAFGVELAGAGTARVAGVSLEPLGEGPPVARPRNLDFSEGT